MQVITHPVLSDNYAHFVVCPKTQKLALIDTPDSSVILNFLRQNEFELQCILNTHHHWDHMGGNTDVLQEYDVPVYGGEFDQKRIDGLSQTVKEGDVVSVGHLNFEVLDVPGHTLGHVAYYGHGALFCGDTIFVGGCGRLFEGTPQQMWESLSKIKALPDDTKIYCAHEYTLQNLEFALTVEPGNKDLQDQLQKAKALRKQGLPTVPSTLADEKRYNPFLRWDSQEIQTSLKEKGFQVTDGLSVFTAVRALKDQY